QRLTKGIRANSSRDKAIFRSIEAPGTVKLNPQDTQIRDYLKRQYETLLDRLNRSRAAIGSPAIPKRKDYISHIREHTLLENIYADVNKVPDEELIALKYAKPNSPAFKFANERLGGRYAESAIGAFQAYIRPALRQINL